MIWFNAGKIDSVGLLYLENACMIPDDSAPIIGRENIKGYYWYIYNSGFRFTENKTDNLVISKDVLVDRGTWRGNIKNVFNMSGSFMSQSRYIDGKWYIENEISNSDTSESPAGQ